MGVDILENDTKKSVIQFNIATPDDDATEKEDKGDEKSDVYLIYVLIGFD